MPFRCTFETFKSVHSQDSSITCPMSFFPPFIFVSLVWLAKPNETQFKCLFLVVEYSGSELHVCPHMLRFLQWTTVYIFIPLPYAVHHFVVYHPRILHEEFASTHAHARGARQQENAIKTNFFAEYERVNMCFSDSPRLFYSFRDEMLVFYAGCAVAPLLLLAAPFSPISFFFCFHNSRRVFLLFIQFIIIYLYDLYDDIAFGF